MESFAEYTHAALLAEYHAAVAELVAAVEATAAGWCCDPHTPCDADVEGAAAHVEERLAVQVGAVERIIRREGAGHA